MESVILTSPTILIISLIAVILIISARFISNKYLRTVFCVVSFTCVAGCTVYALLLGVELKELSAYISVFTLLGLTSFIPAPNEKSSASGIIEITEEKKDAVAEDKSDDEADDEERVKEENTNEL